MKLILTVELENDALDGPTLRAALMPALEVIGRAINLRGLEWAEKLTLTPAGLPQPVSASFHLAYQGSGEPHDPV